MKKTKAPLLVQTFAEFRARLSRAATLRQFADLAA
jgi:hypothetical protein